jgi:hypothetical protein
VALPSGGYPALVERALRLIEARGPCREEELCRELFGASGGPWGRLIGQVLGPDDRLRRSEDGCWDLARRATTRPSAPPGAGGGTVGLVVLAVGPKPWKHPIVALGAARRGPGGAVERFETLVRPRLVGARPCRVPKYLERVGVRAEELDEAPDPEAALAELLAFAGRARLVGLDVGLAAARLQFALREAGGPPLENGLVELAVADETKPDLEALARRRRLPVPSRPTPGALAELALRLAEGDPSARGDGASALGATTWRRLLDARTLGSIPEAPGVYRFLDRSGRALYVGKATSLRARLASYLNGQFGLIRSMPGLVEATARLEHEVLPCELAARAREAELIARHRPAYNVQRRPDGELRWAALGLDGEPAPDGARVPRLRLRLSAGPSPDAALAPVAAARTAYRRLAGEWWPARPRRAARPSPAAVHERLRALAGRLAAELRVLPLAGGLVGGELAGGLLVVAPARPLRPAGATEPEPDEGWTRERYDRAWPPAALFEPFDPVTGADVPGRPDGAAWADGAEPPEPGGAEGETGEIGPGGAGGGERAGVEGGAGGADWAAIEVGPEGLRRAVGLAVEAVDDASELRRAAAEAIAGAAGATGWSAEPGGVWSGRGDPAAGLAALSVTLTALRRGEAGVRAWPLGSDRPWG